MASATSRSARDAHLQSDIHGNPIALDAVLADIQDQGGVDSCWVLGDIVAIGLHRAPSLSDSLRYQISRSSVATQTVM